MKTKDKAKQLLERLALNRPVIEHLTALEPILKAAAEGKRIQYLLEGNDKAASWVTGHELSFSDPAAQYRIGPEIRRTKRFWWKSTLEVAFRYTSPYVLVVVTEEEQAQEPRENWAGFIGWIDTDWQEHEIPTT